MSGHLVAHSLVRASGVCAGVCVRAHTHTHTHIHTNTHRYSSVKEFLAGVKLKEQLDEQAADRSNAEAAERTEWRRGEEQLEPSMAGSSGVGVGDSVGQDKGAGMHGSILTAEEEAILAESLRSLDAGEDEGFREDGGGVGEREVGSTYGAPPFS